MSTYMKPGQPWLYDETTGDIVGVKDADGGETIFSKWNDAGNALVHPATGTDVLSIDSSGNLVATVAHNTDTLANLLSLPGVNGEISVPTDANSLVLHNGVAGQARISSGAVVHAAPNTAAIYTSPIAGEPDTTTQYSLASLANHLVVGFLMPKNGIVTDIGIIGQGNAGAGTARTIRWTVATTTQDNTAATGLAIGQILDTNTTTVADNVNGNVLLATGKSIAVPPQFVVCVKAGLSATYNVQLMNSAGPLPGVIGSILSSTLTPAATYGTTTIDVNATPAVPTVGDQLQVLNIKGIALYIKWKGQ